MVPRGPVVGSHMALIQVDWCLVKFYDSTGVEPVTSKRGNDLARVELPARPHGIT
jgi:hypothetical protein